MIRIELPRIITFTRFLQHLSEAGSMHISGPVERVVRAEGHDLAIGQDVVDTAFFGRAHVEVPGIHEGDDDDTEHVLVEQAAMFFLRQCLGSHRQAAAKVP